RLYGADHANVQVYSGSTANYAVYAACLKVGDTVLAMSPHQGGHATHGSKANIVSEIYNFVHYGVDPASQLIDYDKLRQLALEAKPKLIVAGGSTYSQSIDFAKIAEIAGEVGAYFLVDMAHYTGVIAAGLMPSPVPYADFVTGSTTKTICGPRSGFILCKKQYAEMIDNGAYPKVVASLHLQTMAAMAHAFKYAQSREFIEVMKATVRNARKLCLELQKRGFKIVSDGTECHLMVVDLRNRGINAKAFSKILESINVSTNAVDIPYDDSPVRNGLRIGCTVVAQRGMGDREMEEIADIISEVAENPYDENVLRRNAERVKALCDQFPLYGRFDKLSEERRKGNAV
ncbi:MAG: serine hydroxymethyltransferase, partial [Erysipelotrichaceae bacterium]|nr:serine hydroxymethyltransferase [Erysipelotrichaceae bacterium]